ncbi:hypothetical protein FRC18_010929 [Serendipita sp. 400]|nr:hypothetical protein FRC18_010929 [Serendipita sp. 400]
MSTPPTSTSDAMDDVLPTNRHSGETTAIDTPVPTTLEIWCIVLGEKVPFPVTIARNQSVGHLKEAIHSKKKTLQFTDANLLTLYELNLPRSKDLPETLENMKLDATQALDAIDDLSDVFPNTLKKKTVHVLVQPPKSDKMIPPTTLLSVTPASPRPDEEIKSLIETSIDDLRKVINEYLTNDAQLPLWQAQQGSDHMRRHIANLKIPTTTTPPSPSLLLHNLGQPSHDPLLVRRVEKLFTPDSRLRFLCNTSGSGKTRLLLEGLWRNWGFYFTARNKPDEIGSSDFMEVLEDMRRLIPLTEDNCSTAQAGNRDFTSRRFLLLIYVRLLVFRIYLECASKMAGGIMEEHKGRWLLLQIAPATLLEDDIFLRQVRWLRGSSHDLLDYHIVAEHRLIRDLLGHLHIFCVLDEAQVPANQYANCFLSDTEPITGRPILRQVIHEWVSRIPNLIVSGTGVSMEEVQTVLGSAVAKEGGQEPETVTELGGFENEQNQRAYLEHYLPSGFFNTVSAEGVASRAGYWLLGRHRFTATYLSRLIQMSFESPHAVLNDFVHGMTDIWPSDWDGDLTRTVDLKKPHGFDFSSLLNRSEKQPSRLSTVASFVFEYIFTGKIRGLGGPEGDKMVEYGLSRFKGLSQDGSRTAETDEPLAILGLVSFLSKQHLMLGRYLTDALNAANASIRGFAFEPFGAYLLARAFSSPRPLSDIFEFVGDSELKGESAELVTLKRLNGTFTSTPLNINSELRSNHLLGHSPDTSEDTLGWLEDPQGSALCFPAHTVGPDLIFVLRLTSDGTCLHVCVQFKHTKRLGYQETMKAIHTTDPFNFLSECNGNGWTTHNPSMQQRLQQAIQNLGTGTSKAGDYGVLQVVFSHPSPLHREALEAAVKETHGHPIATVPISNLEPPDSELGQAILSLGMHTLRNSKKKRERVEESTRIMTRAQKKVKTGF